MTLLFTPLLGSVRLSVARPLPLRTSAQTVFSFLISNGEWLIPPPPLSPGGSCNNTTAAFSSTPVSSATMVHAQDLAQSCWIDLIIRGCILHFGFPNSLDHCHLCFLFRYHSLSDILLLGLLLTFLIHCVPRLPSSKCYWVGPGDYPCLWYHWLQSPALPCNSDVRSFLSTLSTEWIVIALAFDVAPPAAILAKAVGACAGVRFYLVLFSRSSHSITHYTLSYHLPLYHEDDPWCFNFPSSLILLDERGFR